MEPHYYNVDINWNTERKGMMCSPELIKDAGSCIEVATCLISNSAKSKVIMLPTIKIN